jgi:hypothetical protein
VCLWLPYYRDSTVAKFQLQSYFGVWERCCASIFMMGCLLITIALDAFTVTRRIEDQITGSRMLLR